jgi:hypothetical protein
VKRFVIFINELSLTPESVMTPEEMLPHVLATLAAIRATRKMRHDLVVAGQVPLAGVFFDNGTHSLAAVLRGDAHKEEWRLLQNLDQSSPWEAYPGLRTPGGLQEVHFQGTTALGMLWAKQNESTIVSFAFPPNWEASHVQAHFHEMDEAGDINSAEIQIPNLSKPEHVTIHRDLIANYGRTMSSSSVVYDGDGFVVRMFFNDHNPPHFHVMARRDTSETLAKCAIETLDLLSGELSAVLRARVTEWAKAQRGDLMRCWTLCRTGQHPFSLQD